MKILVTGGAGYIGSIVAEFLCDAGHHVIVIDDLSTGHRDALEPRARFVEGSILDRETTLPVLSDGIDAVCHFAAFSLVAESMEHPLKYYRNNIAGAVSLLGAMKEAGVGYFLFSSTAAVYGEPASVPITENAPLNPVNAYGNTKLAVERLLADCHAAWGLKFLCLRYFNAAGASERFGEDHHPETHLIPLVIDAACGKRPELVVYGDDYPTLDGTCVRDYIHVKDLASAHLLGLDKLVRGLTGALNLGNGRGFSVREVVKAGEEVMGRKVPYRIGERRAGDPAVLFASSAKAEELLGWDRAYPDIEKIIRDAYEWRKRFPRGYGS
ncbi:MAG TPA: UDP-glucose 4-epimerase GalE [Patescibacteria group bacterium]|nr:UDP-glucose 4-epimerase GalE [Patescibacteria group bacterium]